MNSGPQRMAIGKPDAVMIPTISLRLGDQLFVSPSAVVDQSLFAIRPAISLLVEGAVDCCLARLSSHDILIPAYGNGRKHANTKRYWNQVDPSAQTAQQSAKQRSRLKVSLAVDV